MTFQRENDQALKRESDTPTVAVARAVLPVANDLTTHFALPIEEILIRETARTRNQIDINMPPIPVAKNLRALKFYPVLQWIE